MRKNHLLYWLVPIGLIISSLLFAVPTAYADGGAPNLAYVAGAAHGLSVIDIQKQQVTSTITVSGDPYEVQLSLDGRFLYVTQPQLGQVSIIAARTGQTVCSVHVPGHPTLLALDANFNLIFAAANDAASVTAFDTSNCHIKYTLHTDGPVYGMAVATVASAQADNGGDQLWVAAKTLCVFDTLRGKQISNVPLKGDPQFVTIPVGTTVYVTTRQGEIDAVDLSTYHVVSLLSGGTYGPMDFDEITGEIYVPDMQHDQLLVLTPVNAGYTVPHEPGRVIHFNTAPQAVAITSDGQLGFVALQGGSVAMLDIPGRQLISTIQVGGNPHFIITGLYPPIIGTTPQQASVFGTLANIGAYIFLGLLVFVPLLILWRYSRGNKKTSS
jgi:DNA-binding beta-propeller fold protein YncE